MVKFLFKKSFLISIFIALCLVVLMFYNLIFRILVGGNHVLSYNFLYKTNLFLWICLTIVMFISFTSFVVRINEALKSKYKIKKYFNQRSNVWNAINLISSLFSALAIKIVHEIFQNKVTYYFNSSRTEHYIVLAAISFLILVIIPILYICFIKFSSEIIVEEEASVDLEAWFIYFSISVKSTNEKQEKKENKKRLYLDFVKKVYVVLHETKISAELKFKLKNKIEILSVHKRTQPLPC